MIIPSFGVSNFSQPDVGCVPLKKKCLNCLLEELLIFAHFQFFLDKLSHLLIICFWTVMKKSGPE